MWRSTITFVNGRIVTPGGVAASLRFAGSILSVGEAPHRHDVVVDLDGAFVLPGLINAHDHLELNHYGRWKFRERYDNASAWIDDMTPQLRADPRLIAGQSHRLAHRLFIGGLKNLLAGTTTVAHHNPLYREIGRFCPVRVVRNFGWAHSFQLEGRPAGARGEAGGCVEDQHHNTPADVPFILHLGEGVDTAAEAELDRLESAGCLAANTVIVHGIALTMDQWRRVGAAGASLVWCPASNQFLLGRTPDIRALIDDVGMRPRIALGSDSRISGARDLLDELRVARDSAAVTVQELMNMVTTNAADVLRLANAGRIATGLPADLIILPNRPGGTAAATLLNASRADIRLVMIAGRPLVGGVEFESVFRERRVPTEHVSVDHADKLMDASIAKRLARSPIGEDGVEMAAATPQRTYAFVTSR